MAALHKQLEVFANPASDARRMSLEFDLLDKVKKLFNDLSRWTRPRPRSG